MPTTALASTHSSVLRPCRLHILVIDDDAPLLRAMARRLRPHDVSVAVGALEAFALLDQRSADVIFCDVNMPIVRGAGVYEYLQRVYPGEEERIVFMTGAPLAPGPSAYLSAIPNPVLRKPISDAELQGAIARARSAPQFDISRASAPRAKASR